MCLNMSYTLSWYFDSHNRFCVVFRGRIDSRCCLPRAIKTWKLHKFTHSYCGSSCYKYNLQILSLPTIPLPAVCSTPGNTTNPSEYLLDPPHRLIFPFPPDIYAILITSHPTTLCSVLQSLNYTKSAFGVIAV